MTTSNHTGLRQTKGRFIENFGPEFSPPVSSICGVKDHAGSRFPLESPPSLVVFYDGRDPSLTPADMRNDGVLHSPTLTLISEAAITPLRLPSPCSPVIGEPTEWLLSRRYVSQGPFSAPVDRIISQTCRDGESTPDAEPGEDLPTEDSDSDWFTVSDEVGSECHNEEGRDLDGFSPKHDNPASTTHMTSLNTLSCDENRLPTATAAPRCRLQDTPSLCPSTIPRGFRSRPRVDLHKEDQLLEEGSDVDDVSIGFKMYRV